AEAPAPRRQRTLRARRARLLQPPRRAAGGVPAREAPAPGGLDDGAPADRRPLPQGAGGPGARAASRGGEGAPRVPSVHPAAPAARPARQAPGGRGNLDRRLLPALGAGSADVRRRRRAALARGLARLARGPVAAVLRRAHRRRGRARGRGCAPRVRAPVTPAAEALRQRLAASPTLGLIGLGYVGLPLAVAFAASGAHRVGVDLDARRAAAVRAGASFIEDVPAEQLSRLVRAGRLSAHDDVGTLKDADAIVICVPTPLGKSKEPDISFIVAAADAVASIIRPGQLVALESTTYPGTTQEILAPRLEAKGVAVGRDIFLAFSPERIDPGNRRFTLREIPKVVGGVTEACRELATLLYARV